MERAGDGSDSPDGEKDEQLFDPFVGEHHDLVAASNARRFQPYGDSLDRVEESREVDLLAAVEVDDRGLFGMRRSVPSQQIGDGGKGDCEIPRGPVHRPKLTNLHPE